VIHFDRISKRHGKQLLFVDASAVIHRVEKVGLVGPNGAGKSTLFRMVMREETPDEGQVSIDRGVTIGNFSQDVGELRGKPVVEETMDGAGPVSQVAAELHALEHALADPERADQMDALIERFGNVQARYEELGDYGLEARAREIHAGLGFAPEAADAGNGASVKMGYFAQHAMELLSPEKSVWDVLVEAFPRASVARGPGSEDRAGDREGRKACMRSSSCSSPTEWWTRCSGA
jgi:ATPase subunit of ABC transporter with duplicated ATPase domains